MTAADPPMQLPPHTPNPKHPMWGCGVLLAIVLAVTLGVLGFHRVYPEYSAPAPAPPITAEPRLERELRELDRRVMRLEVDRTPRPCTRGRDEITDLEDERTEREEQARTK